MNEAVPANESRRAPLIILIVFGIVMAFLGYEMMQFKRAGKQVHGVAVTVTPAQLTLKPGESRLIEASVVGSENGDVGWSVQEGVMGGTIATASAMAHDGRAFAAANYTAPKTLGVYHVVAISKADESRSSTATITVVQ